MLKLAFALGKLTLVTGGFLAIFTGLHFVALEFLVPKPEVQVNVADLEEVLGAKVSFKEEKKAIKVGEKLRIKLQIGAGAVWHSAMSSDLGDLEDKGISGDYKVFEFEAKKVGKDYFYFFCTGLNPEIISYYKLTLTVEP